ncbi:MAG: hypothetical protein U9R38_05330 [Candidatus Margulisiibacteriota bacterium]|nr:hypothetical protein [Candidatus Margulisiibacteriota bacterium]
MKQIWLPLIFFLFISPVFAEEVDVNIKADKLRQIEGTSIIEASGSVEVELKGIIIKADKIRMDSDTNIVVAEGNVRVITEDYDALSEQLIYDSNFDKSSFNDFETKLAPSNLKGELFVFAENLDEKAEKLEGSGGSVTTCGDDTPHFRTVAEKIEFYPNDKVIGYNVTIYVGRFPALWTPFMYYDLKRKQKRNWEIGRNEVEGDFFKSTWDYPYGTLYLDLMQKKGFGYGIENEYVLGALGLGTLFLYHLDENDTGISNWVTRIDHKKQLNQWTNLSLNHSYTATYLIPAGRRDQTAFGLDLNYNHKARWGIEFDSLDDRIGSLQKYSGNFNQAHNKVSSNYSYNYEFSKKDPKWIRSSQRLTHRRPLWSDNVIFSGKIDYHNYVSSGGEPGDERLEPKFEITGREKNYTWTVRENLYIDMDKDIFVGDNNYQYLERKPEVTISPNPLDLNLFTLSPVVGYGNFHEVRYVSQLGRNRDFSTERYQATINANKNVQLPIGTAMALGAGVDQFVYATDDRRYAYREKVSLRTDLFGFVNNNIHYKKGLSDGNSPFLFDQLGSNYHNVSENLTFSYLNKLSWSNSGGYNWQTEKWFDVMSRLNYTPTAKLGLEIRSGWDIENRVYKDLVNRLRVSPQSFFSMQFSTVSDMNIGTLKSGSILYDMFFLEGEPNQWRLKFGQIFEPSTQQFKVRDIMVVKDLHCWEMKYTYSDFRKEFSFSFSLKALPDEPFGVSSGRGFYYDGFEKGIKEIKSGGDVRRY